MSIFKAAANLSSTPDALGAESDLLLYLTPKYVAGYLALLGTIVWVSWQLLRTDPKDYLIPGVYVVGGSKKHEVKATSARFKDESPELLLDGYRQTKGMEPFYVPSARGPRLIIPTRYMEELKSAPIEQVDFGGIVREMLEYEYTGMMHPSRMIPNALGSHLTPRLATIMPEVQDEIKVAINDDFPQNDNWTEVDVIPGVTRVITRATSRMVAGKTMSQNKDWITAAIYYTLWTNNAAQKVKDTPWPVRRLMAPWFEEVRKSIPWCFDTAAKVIMPILEQREQTGEIANDFLQWVTETAQEDEKDHKFIAHRLLQIAFASIHTSAQTISGLLYDLCQYPELIKIIREEYEPIVDRDGNIPRGGFAKLVKMDSIMKESQRLNPISILTFERIINADKTLKDGFTIPAGHYIGVANYNIAVDPEIFPDPEKFDGLRFEKLRNDPKWTSRAPFVSCNPQTLAFGYGRHACPGRQFMEQEYKSFLVKFLVNYDIKFKDGQSRVKNTPLESQYLLNPTPILLKRRNL